MEDCYFFLYSECKLKDRCMYRHNLMSKDNLITCKVWKKTKKCRVDCPFRHSEYHELKQRKETMCYWEDKGGCTKYRCEYKHKDPFKDEWKEVKIKSLSEIKNIKNTIEIESEKKSLEIDLSYSQVEGVDDTKTVNEYINNNDGIKIEENILVEGGDTNKMMTKELHFNDSIKNLDVKRFRKEIISQEIEDLDKELQELDSLLDDSD